MLNEQKERDRDPKYYERRNMQELYAINKQVQADLLAQKKYEEMKQRKRDMIGHGNLPKSFLNIKFE